MPGQSFADENKYLKLDEKEERYEYYNGDITALSEHSKNHTLIELNIIELLQEFLKEANTKPFADSLRLYNAQGVTYTYPDIIIFEEQPHFIKSEILTVDNPCCIIEIYESLSNINFNPSVKFGFYQFIPLLKEYIMIDADTRRMISISDREEQWFVQEAINMNEGVHSFAINYDFLMVDIYKNIL